MAYKRPGKIKGGIKRYIANPYAMKFTRLFGNVYTILIIACVVMLTNACGKGKKAVTPVSLTPLESTHKMAGTRPMKGFADTDQVDVYDKVYTLPDTAMAISVINDSSITINNILYTYTPQSSNDSMLYFWHIFHGDIFEEASVSYYFRKDSIVCEHLLLVIPHGYLETIYHTY